MNFKTLFLLITFLPAINMAFCQANESIEYHLVNKTYSKKHGGFELAEKQFLTSKFSKDFFYINLLHKDLNEQQIVTKMLSQHDVDISMGDQTFLFYENKDFDDLVILWKMDGEYYSKIYFYYFTEKKIRYLGEVTIGDNCIKEGCEAFNVNKENIHISKINHFVSILFKGEHIFFSKEIVPNGSLSAENLTIDFSIQK